MTRYAIFNNTSGECVGEYEADNEDAALDAMVSDEMHGEGGWRGYVLADLDEDASEWEREQTRINWRADYQVVKR